jgi:hypothetical protein
VLIALSLAGAETQCPWKRLVVEIPDLEVNQIQGLQFWRGDSETSPQLAEAGRIVFGQRLSANGSEVQEYTMVSSQGESLEIFSPAAVVWKEDDSGAATLDFVFPAWSEPPGWIRVTTFNEVGESEPSDEAAFL